MMVKYKYDFDNSESSNSRSKSANESDVLTTLKETIGTYLRPGSGVDCFYIGRTRGNLWEPALKDSYDDFKESRELNYMVCIYETTKETDALSILKDLAEFYRGAPSFVEEDDDCSKRRKPEDCENGISERGLSHYVYLAYRKRWESDNEDDDDDVFM